MGKIFINQLYANAIIGTLPQERLRRQELILDLELTTDMLQASRSDDLCDAVDYSAVENAVLTLVENSSFQLLEALSGAVGRMTVALPGVDRCRVRITKPGATLHGRSVAVEMEFAKGDAAQ